MYALMLASMIITSTPNEPTEIIGSAATPDGERNEITVEQPQNAPNPFGYVAPNEEYKSLLTEEQEEAASAPQQKPQSTAPQTNPQINKLISQSSTVNPTDMNPLHYQNQIENTIYQDGNRLIDVQSIPLKDISAAVQPNIQPEITDYPAF